jgi:hypothetical protein
MPGYAGYMICEENNMTLKSSMIDRDETKQMVLDAVNLTLDRIAEQHNCNIFGGNEISEPFRMQPRAVKITVEFMFGESGSKLAICAAPTINLLPQK